jgi:SAM-dependent MidA family methyltransferase
MVPGILTEPSSPPATTLPAGLAHLPSPDADATAASRELAQAIATDIRTAGGFLPFAQFMALALYAPGLGYYSGGSHKLGAAGDFVTAPELSPLFARSLAVPVAELIAAGCPRVLELGAGSGRLAADLLIALEARNCMPERYSILEVSAQLRQRQQQLIAALPEPLASRVEWLDALPTRYTGIVIGNEVLDAMPVDLVRREGERLLELGVALTADGAGWRWADREATGALLDAACAIDIADGCTTEIHRMARAFTRTVADCLEHGVAIFVDYGFPRHEYYHEQRTAGTLMCHYRHHAHADPLVLPGLQDITAHVDFSAIAEAAVAGGLDLLGYTSQAQFLINCGITNLLSAIDPRDVRAYAPVAAAAQKLLSPAEMGELFKAIAFGRGIRPPLIGFQSGDRSHRL